MSIVNSLTFSNRKRDQLTNNRNGIGFAAFIIILSASVVVFLKVQDAATQFRILCSLGLFTGICSSIFYICAIDEIKLNQEAKELDIKYKIANMGESAGTFIEE
jgi:Na+/melibiose symporter-like transporter